jgi:uncharacterized membrane protein YfcA
MLDIAPIAVVAAAGFFAGLSKGGFGALGGVITPLMSLAMPASRAVGVMLTMFLIGDAIALYVYWRQWDGWRMRLLLPPALAGVAAGTLLLAGLPDDMLRKLLGIFALVLAIYKVAERRLAALEYRPSGWHAALAGGLSGFGSALANAGGPPFSAYLLLQKISPRTFVATTTLFFAVVNLFKVPGYLLSGVLNPDVLLSGLWGMLLVPVGVWVGKRIVYRIDRGAFEALILALLVVSSVLLLVR